MIGFEGRFSRFGDAIAEMASEPIEAQTTIATVSREDGTVSFQVGGNTNIPSDGTPHKVTIFSENYAFKPEYIAIPRLVSFAYLQAVVLNKLNLGIDEGLKIDRELVERQVEPVIQYLAFKNLPVIGKLQSHRIIFLLQSLNYELQLILILGRNAHCVTLNRALNFFKFISN